MGLRMIYLLTLLSTSLFSASVTDVPVVAVGPSVTVHQGHMAILPCWLNPPQNAEDLEVRWFRSDRFDSSIVFYREKKFDASQEASYVGRVSFGLKDASSGGLTGGDVSLKLVNVTIEDTGDYICYVSSEMGYDRESVSLHVIEMGTHPLLSAVWGEDNSVQVSCESEGWYPEPKLRWSDQKQDLTPKELKYDKASSGLVSVRSWLLVSGSSKVSCSVGLSDGEAKESRVRLEKPAEQDSGSSAGWVAFAILLIATLSLLGLLYYKRRDLLCAKDKLERNQAEENEKLLKQAFAEASSYYVNIKLEETGNSYIKIAKNVMLRDSIDSRFPDGRNVTCLTATKGTPGFSSGQHYWEVSLGNEGVGLKQSWWVGVTNASGFPRECSVPPTTSNGFWFLSSSPDRADSFQFSTEPNVLLPVHSRPKTVGVYLNYDSGELSFYNVEDKCVIGSLTAEFTGEVFPLFNPGKNDKAPMEILQRESSVAVNVAEDNEN